MPAKPLPNRRPGPDADLRRDGVVHDVNQMLSIIIGRAGFLRERADTAELRSDLDGIVQAARDASAILRRLHAETEPESNGADMRSCVEQALTVIRPPGGTAWSQELGGAGCWHAANRVAAGLVTSVPASEVREVLHNLLLNALAVMPQGGAVTVDAEQVGERIRLAVTDTGPGLPPAARERLFDAGYTTSGEDGRGLGLAACRQLLADRGGGLELDPAVATGGATFVLDLPVGTAVPTSPPPGDRTAVPRGLHVLVVDDEIGVAEMLGDVLTAWDCRAELVGSAAAARLAFAPDRFDAALVDWTLPGETGRELATWLRARDETLPIVLTTGLDREGELAGTVGETVDFTLVKPLELDELRRILGRVVDLATARGRGPAPD